MLTSGPAAPYVRCHRRSSAPRHQGGKRVATAYRQMEATGGYEGTRPSHPGDSV